MIFLLFDFFLGWEPNSYGFHGDDGNFFNSSGVGNAFSQGYVPGDIVGCGLNTLTGELFFTKNGLFLGIAAIVPILQQTILKNTRNDPEEANSSDIQETLKYYPCVGLRSLGEKIWTNFGQVKFLYPIEAYVQQKKSCIYKDILVQALQPISSTHQTHPRSSSSGDLVKSSGPQSRSMVSDKAIQSLLLDYFVHNGMLNSARSFFEAVTLSLQERRLKI